jgi:hypothetical protein
MEIIANALQTVAANQNVYFTDEVTGGGCSILHRDDSGLVMLKGITNQCRARYKVSFGGNIAIPTGGTVEAISLALAIEGEPVSATTMTVTPAAVEDFWNVFSAVFVDVPRGCCVTISVRNISTQAVEVQNANLIVERVA